MANPSEPTPVLPCGYVNCGELFEDLEHLSGWRWLLFANLLALIPLGAAILLLWLPYQFYAAAGAPFALSEPSWQPWVTGLIGILIIVGSVLLHEVLHGLALRLLGYHPRLLYSRGFLLASVPGFITRRDYLIMILTPVTIMSLGGALFLLWLPLSLGQWWIAALLLNAAASIGDLAVASRVFRFPPSALFADRDGIRVFLRK